MQRQRPQIRVSVNRLVQIALAVPDYSVDTPHGPATDIRYRRHPSGRANRRVIEMLIGGRPAAFNASDVPDFVLFD